MEIRNILFNFKTQFVNIPNVYIKAEMKVYLSNVSDVFFAKLTVEMCVTWPHFIQNDDVTHLVIGQDEDVNIAYLVAMLKGVYIVFDDCKSFYSSVLSLGIYIVACRDASCCKRQLAYEHTGVCTRYEQRSDSPRRGKHLFEQA